MIEKFNFYDIYGYFVPGFALLFLMWLPYGMLGRPFPGSGSELSLTVAGIVFAYIVGHFLQLISAPALPSQVKDFKGNLRDLSELMLDPDELEFTQEFKNQLSAHARGLFGRDLSISETGEGHHHPVSSARQEVFRMARAELVRKGKAPYVEQFEGLYSLMRGLTTAFAFGAAYFGGWALALVEQRWLRVAGFGVACGGLAVTALLGAEMLRRGAEQRNPEAEKTKPAAQRQSEAKNRAAGSRCISRSIYFLLLLVTFTVGCLLGFGIVRLRSQSGMLVIAGAGALVAALKFYGGYRSYAKFFAKEVWSGFLSCTGVSPPGTAATS